MNRWFLALAASVVAVSAALAAPPPATHEAEKDGIELGLDLEIRTKVPPEIRRLEPQGMGEWCGEVAITEDDGRKYVAVFYADTWAGWRTQKFSDKWSAFVTSVTVERASPAYVKEKDLEQNFLAMRNRISYCRARL